MLKFFCNLRVRAKLLLSFFAVLMLTTAASVSSLLFIDSTLAAVEKTDALLTRDYEQISSIQNRLAAMDYRIYDFLSGRISDQSERTRAVFTLIDEIKVFEADLREMRASDQADRAKLDKVRQLALEWGKTFRTRAKAQLLIGSLEGFSAVYNESLGPLNNQAYTVCSEIIAGQHKRITDMTGELADSPVRREVIIAMVAALILGIVIALAISSNILSHLRYCSDRARRIAEGELDIRIHSRTSDEFGQLINSLERMKNAINEHIGTVAEQTTEVVARLNDITHDNRSVADELQMHQNHVVNVSSAVSEMSNTTAEIARSCESAALSSEQSHAATSKGISSARNTIERIRAQADHTRKDAANIAALVEHSKSISAVVTTIEDIASKTNLLALNAAIEAARAGAAGRGFAVVADEVCALAAQTAQSTSRIRATIESVQKNTSSCLESMNASVSNIESIADEANSLEGIFDDIEARVDSLNDQVTRISAAAEQQHASTGEISQNVCFITSTGEHISGRTCDNLSAIDELVERVFHMQKAVSYFRTDATARMTAAAASAKASASAQELHEEQQASDGAMNEAATASTMTGSNTGASLPAPASAAQDPATITAAAAAASGKYATSSSRSVSASALSSGSWSASGSASGSWSSASSPSASALVASLADRSELQRSVNTSRPVQRDVQIKTATSRSQTTAAAAAALSGSSVLSSNASGNTAATAALREPLINVAGRSRASSGTARSPVSVPSTRTGVHSAGSLSMHQQHSRSAASQAGNYSSVQLTTMAPAA